MPVVSSRYFRKDDLDFKVSISVSKEGVFSTTLPIEVVSKLKTAGVVFERNRLGHDGHVSSKTLYGVESAIQEALNEYASKELIEEKLVIRYDISIACTYCKDPEGNIVPNGTWANPGDSGRGAKWIDGTDSRNSSNSGMYGVRVYAGVFNRKLFRTKAGKETTEYSTPDLGNQFSALTTDDPHYYLAKLNAFVGLSCRGDLLEIDYTERSAKFFVDLLTYICTVNERIKESIPPDILSTVLNGSSALTWPGQELIDAMK